MNFMDQDKWLKLHYVGLQPMNNEMYFSFLFRSLRDFAPSDASIIFQIEQLDNVLKGILYVNSATKRFTSVCYADEISNLAEKVKKDMNWQIDAWKNNRHFDLVI